MEDDPVRSLSEFIDDIKEKLTDAEYKMGMELCQTIFKQEKPDEKLYRMTYLNPIVFSDDHDCDEDDCPHSRSLNIGFVKKTSLIKLRPDRAKSILEENCYTGDDIEDFIDTSVLQHHQEYEMEIPEFEWDTFPVLKLEEVTL
jgi:hypothetical protein